MIAILGKNGTGKSTIFQLCNGILLPQKGLISIDGMDTRDRKHRACVRQRIGILFQFPEKYFFGATVAEEFAFPLKNWTIPEKSWETRIDMALKKVSLPRSIVDRSPFTLSGGEMRLVSIATLLLTEPAYVLLDEPTIGLDAKGKRMVRELIATFREEGRTCVVITHDLQFAFDLESSRRGFDEYWLLEKGKNPWKVGLQDLCRQDALEEKYGLVLPSMIEYQRLKSQCKESQE